jgi:hypothetical protein
MRVESTQLQANDDVAASAQFELARTLYKVQNCRCEKVGTAERIDHRQRLFLFGKISGLNDKDSALAAGYSLSVVESTKPRIWKNRLRRGFERLQDAGAVRRPVANRTPRLHDRKLRAPGSPWAR